MKQPEKRAPQVVLGVTASIAAIKAPELARQLAAAGCDVRVVRTPHASHFIDDGQLEQASGKPVLWDQFLGVEPGLDPASLEFSHISLSRADLLLVAPATADFIGRMAAGLAGNLLLAAYLASDCPVLVCPAMNQRMWEHPAVQENLSTLRRRGVRVVPPDTGRLACGEEGPGRLADVDRIIAAVKETLGGSGGRSQSGSDFSGLGVLVTAGATREAIDSVRYITNRSSGKMGYAIAEAALARGATVTVVAANVFLPRNPHICYIDVVSASDMQKQLEAQAGSYDILFMAAAVSDYKVSGNQTMGKIARQDKIDLHLVTTSDIVSNLGRYNKYGLKVGFAAEYGEDKQERARCKLQEKDLDMIVFNDISRADTGFESDYNEIILMAKDRGDVFVSKATKAECAERILDAVAELLS